MSGTGRCAPEAALARAVSRTVKRRAAAAWARQAQGRQACGGIRPVDHSSASSQFPQLAIAVNDRSSVSSGTRAFARVTRWRWRASRNESRIGSTLSTAAQRVVIEYEQHLDGPRYPNLTPVALRDALTRRCDLMHGRRCSPVGVPRLLLDLILRDGRVARIRPGEASTCNRALVLCTVLPYTYVMIVRSFRHRGLRQLFETNSSRLLKQDLVERVRGILAALAMAETLDGFVHEAAPGWRVHRLSGTRRNEWSISVSGNWRITFEERDGGIEHVNLEDYH